MTDQTLPLSGGWILITKTPNTKIRLKPLSIFYAMPDKVFVKDSHWIGNAFRYGGQYKDAALLALYRLRRNSTALQSHEIEAARKIEADFLEVEGYELELDQRVKIETPGGTLWIEPHEWTEIKDITPYTDAIGDGYILHEYGVTAKVSSKIKDQLFYMQTRGLPKSSALALLSGSAKSSSLFWLEAEQELIDYFYRGAA